jgi:hypothetical protein
LFARGVVKLHRTVVRHGRVENVWKNRGSTVELLTPQVFFVWFVTANRTLCTLLMRLRWSFRLNAAAATLDYNALSDLTHTHFDVILNVHRFAEVINGREFKIEVSPVAPDKWRAQLARPAGGSAATMPFYGNTPVEAAGHLSRWLCLAHGTPRGQL